MVRSTLERAVWVRALAGDDICPLIVSKEKQSAQEFQLLFSSVNMEGNQTRFNECSDSDIDNHPRIHHHHVYARFNCEKKINGRVIK